MNIQSTKANKRSIQNGFPNFSEKKQLINKDLEEPPKPCPVRRNISHEKQIYQSSYGHFYSERFVNSEQTAILKTVYD